VPARNPIPTRRIWSGWCEYDVPDRAGNGTGELIVLLSTILDPVDARAEELAAAYHDRWEEETANDQVKTHLRGPGRVLRSRLPDLVRQEIWAWLSVHYALAVLIARAAEAADIDPDRISYTRTLRLVRRTATGTAAFPLRTGTRRCPLTADLRRPWERSPTRPGRLSPARVRRGFRNIHPKTTHPAGAPKPSRPGPGRPPGSRNKHIAPRPPVGKTRPQNTTTHPPKQKG
jgi:hypothetical protein